MSNQTQQRMGKKEKTQQRMGKKEKGTIKSANERIKVKFYF